MNRGTTRSAEAKTNRGRGGQKYAGPPQHYIIHTPPSSTCYSIRFTASPTPSFRGVEGGSLNILHSPPNLFLEKNPLIPRALSSRPTYQLQTGQQYNSSLPNLSTSLKFNLQPHHFKSAGIGKSSN